MSGNIIFLGKKIFENPPRMLITFFRPEGELWERIFEARKAPREGQKKQPHVTVERHARLIFWLTLPKALFPF